MKIRALVVAASIGSMFVLMAGMAAQAAEVKVVSGVGLKSAFSELGPQFEGATGHKLVMVFGHVAALKRKIDAGETVDVIILSPTAIDDLIKHGKVAADSRANVGRTGIGVAGRKGAPKPDISSVDAFKRAMLDANSVAYAKEGQSRKVLFAAFDRLGIAADMKPKLKGYVRPEQAVIKGEAELGVTGIGAILAATDAQFVGGFPPELQSYIVFAAGVNASTKQPEASRALIHFITTPASAQVLKATGVDPS